MVRPRKSTILYITNTSYRKYTSLTDEIKNRQFKYNFIH